MILYSGWLDGREIASVTSREAMRVVHGLFDGALEWLQECNMYGHCLIASVPSYLLVKDRAA